MTQGESARREWAYYLVLGLWILASQAWFGPRVRDFFVDDASTLLVIQGRPIDLPRLDPRDLYRLRAQEIQTRLFKAINRPHPVLTWRFLADHEAHPPLYFWLLQLWVSLFGNYPRSWAIFAALQLLIAGLLLYRLARTELDPLLALIPSLCLPISLPILNQSQTLRHYLLTFIFTCLSLLLAYPAARPDPSSPSKSSFHWIGLGVALAAGLTTHYLFGLVVLGINLATLPGLWRAPRSLKLQWLGSQALAAVLFAPTLRLFFIQSRQFQALERIFTPPGAIASGTFEAYVSYFFSYPGRLTIPILIVLGLSLLGYLTRQPRPLLRFHFGISLMAFGLYPFLVWAKIFRLNYALASRFFMVAAPLVLILPALGAARLPRAWMRAVPIGILPILMLLHAVNYTGYLRQLEASLQPASLSRNRLLAAFVAKNLDRDDVLLLETKYMEWMCVCLYLPPDQRVWFGPEGSLSAGLERISSELSGPAQPRRILYAATVSQENSEAEKESVLHLLSQTYQLLPQKIETKEWRIFFLRSRDSG